MPGSRGEVSELPLEGLVLLVQDEYTEFLLQIEIFLQRISVSTFGFHFLLTKLHLLRLLKPLGKDRAYRLLLG